jgi:hypothetical protein
MAYTAVCLATVFGTAMMGGGEAVCFLSISFFFSFLLVGKLTLIDGAFVRAFVDISQMYTAYDCNNNNNYYYYCCCC